MVMGASSLDGTWLTTLMIVVGTAISLWALRRNRLLSRQREHQSAQKLEALQSTSEMRSTADGIMVDLESFARQMSAQLDTKCARLEALLDAADERLDALRQLESPTPASHQTQAEPEPEVPRAIEKIDITVGDSEPSLDSPVQEPASGPSPAEDNIEAPEEETREPEKKSVEAGDEERAEIYELADLGHSPLRIAQALKRPVGEIELILQLRSFA